MRRRRFAVAFLVAAAHGCAPQAEGRLNAVGPGDKVPAVALTGARPALVWVFDAEDCLGCELTEPARTVRALQRRLGDGLETVAVARSEKGEEDRRMVDSFLRAQLISARVEVRTAEELLREYGSVRQALYLVRPSGVVAAVVAPDEASWWRSADGVLDLVGFVETLAEEQGSP